MWTEQEGEEYSQIDWLEKNERQVDVVLLQERSKERDMWIIFQLFWAEKNDEVFESHVTVGL